MNIFILDEDPVIAAQMQCDKHIVKMPTELAQMLSSAHRVLDGFMNIKTIGRKTKYWTHPVYDDELYKVSHVNHPCSVWVREASENYKWAYQHFISLCSEYTFRYNKIHACETKLKTILSSMPDNIEYGKTDFALGMKTNPECIVLNNPVLSYRNFYKTKSDKFKMTWTNRDSPYWW
jgi:hypothetical protein